MLKKLRELVKLFLLRDFQLAAGTDTMNSIAVLSPRNVFQLLSALYRIYISVYADNVRKTLWFKYVEMK